MKKITEKMINDFMNYLLDNEKSKATLEKYVRDIKAFALWLGSAELSKATAFLIMQRNTALK